jgi:hypothetical protein
MNSAQELFKESYMRIWTENFVRFCFGIHMVINGRLSNLGDAIANDRKEYPPVDDLWVGFWLMWAEMLGSRGPCAWPVQPDPRG